MDECSDGWMERMNISLIPQEQFSQSESPAKNKIKDLTIGKKRNVRHNVPVS